MKTINIKLASFTFAAMLLASCSDSSTDIPSTPANPKVVGEKIISETNAEKLAKSVVNYKVDGTLSRATTASTSDLADVYDMPKQASTVGAIELSGDNSCKGLESSKKYIVTGNITSDLNLNGATLFIKGTLTTSNIWGGSAWINNAAQKGKIYILEGGTLNINNNNTALFQNAGIYCYNYGGTLNKAGDNMYIESGDAYYTTGDIVVKNELKIQGRLYVGGKAKIGKLSTESNAQINIQGNVEGTENQDLSVDGCLLNIGGKAKFNKLTVGGSAPKFYACSVEVTGTTRLNSNGAETHITNLKTGDIYQCAGSTMYLTNNSKVDCAGTYQNENNGNNPYWSAGNSRVVLLGDNANAIFKANEVKYNGSNNAGNIKIDNDKYAYFSTCYIFQAKGSCGVIYMDCDKFTNNGNTATYTYAPGLSDNTKRYIADECPVAETSCDGSVTPPPVVPEEPKKKIDIISVVDYTGHDHDISATCIQPYNGKLYMSYHTNKENQEDATKEFGGCIEVFKTENDQTTLLQYLQDEKQLYDFNHLMVDDKDNTKYVYVTGSTNKNGGMFARIALDGNGLLNTDVKQINDSTFENPLIVINWGESQSDENAIVRDGDKLLIASAKGYGVYDAKTLELVGKKVTPGKAKHIAINGNTLATFHYTERAGDAKDSDQKPLAGIVQEFATGSDILTATPSKEIAVESVQPNDGKNTIAIDGNYLYVCRSAKGLSCYDRNTGAELWNWGAPPTANTRVPQGYANGVTYDANYIYLACGSYGLVILDKNKKDVSGKPVVVAKKRSEASMSANYVTLDNGYIYVAYGKSRLRVMKLVDGTASGGNTDYNTKK